MTQPRHLPATAKSLGYLEVTKAEAGTAEAKPVFRITAEVLDRVSDRVIKAGLNIANYLRNPVLLWNHNDGEPAIGTARVFQESGEWFMEPSFDGIGERSKEVGAKVAAGTLRTCSIRFRILKHAFNDDGGLDVLESELLEVSITNIPCNPEAERVKNNPEESTATLPTPSEEQPKKTLSDADIQAIAAALLPQIAEKFTAAMNAFGKAKAEEQPAPEPAKAEEQPEPMAEEGPTPKPLPTEEDATKSFLASLSRRRT
jgi:hypothetical protein